MGLISRTYPALEARHSSTPLVFIHGWASDATCWQAILPALNKHFDIVVINLPGFGGSDILKSCALDDWLQALLSHLPERGIYIGWSLGGMLATALAGQHSDRVEALVTIASNARFVRAQGWPAAMPAKVERGFYQNFIDAPERTLKTFAALEAQGDADERAALKLLRAQQKNVSPVNDGWGAALQLLALIDNRQSLGKISQPSLHIFGDSDALVPASCALAIKRLNENARVEVLEECGHAPHLTQPKKLLPLVQSFLSAAI